MEQMHFAIDQDPCIVQAKRTNRPNRRPSYNNPRYTRGHADGEHASVKLVDFKKATRKWRSWLVDVYQKDGLSTSVCHRQRRPDGLPVSGSGVFT